MSVRLPAYLLIGLALAACTTDVRSLTHVEASLEPGPDLGPMSISYFGRVPAPAKDPLEVHLNGQPIVSSNGETFRVGPGDGMVDAYMPRGTATISFLRDGKTVAQSDPLVFEPDRVNHLLLHGDATALALLVVSDPYQLRRVRLINLHERQEAVEYALLDADEQPLTAAATLEYGEWWAHTVDENVSYVSVSAPGTTSSNYPINCDPSFRLLVHRKSPGENGTTSLAPLHVPSRPESKEEQGRQCYEPDCNCE